MNNLNQYTQWLQEQNLHPKTIRSYLWTIKQYSSQSLTTEQISQFLKENQTKYQPSTLRNQRNALASYAKFQSANIEWKKINRLIPTIQRKFYTTINESELTRLKEVKTETSPKLQARNNLLLDFLFYSGLRVGELVNIKHADWQDNSLRVKGKGNKIRQVFLPEFLAKHFNSSKEYLFLTKRNKQFTEAWIRMLIKRKVIKSKIIKNITPHTFRRSLATNLYNRGGKLETIHSNIQTTLGYIHNDFNTLYADYSKLLQFRPEIKLSLKDYTNAELLAELSRREGGIYA